MVLFAIMDFACCVVRLSSALSSHVSRQSGTQPCQFRQQEPAGEPTQPEPPRGTFLFLYAVLCLCLGVLGALFLRFAFCAYFFGNFQHVANRFKLTSIFYI